MNDAHAQEIAYQLKRIANALEADNNDRKIERAEARRATLLQQLALGVDPDIDENGLALWKDAVARRLKENLGRELAEVEWRAKEGKGGKDGAYQ